MFTPTLRFPLSGQSTRYKLVRGFALSLLVSLLLSAILGPHWRQSWGRSSPEQTLLTTFPMLAKSLAARAEFTPITRVVAGREVPGLIAKIDPHPSINDPVAPAGLRPQE